jgi:hypothetical protein
VAQQQRLEYLRPILGHIHSGGLRFKDKIEMAFKRQALMLFQSRRRLMDAEIQPVTNINGRSALPDELLLRALWPCSRELHYVAHYSKPLDVRVGDIGYISGNPPKFTGLDNVYEEISDGHVQSESVQPLRMLPVDRWSTEEVQGVVRCDIHDMVLIDLPKHSGMHFTSENLTLVNSRTGVREDQGLREILRWEG